LSQVGFAPGNYQLYVDAVAKPCIRDHLSLPASYSLSASPAVTQQPANATVSYGGIATFSVSATGMSPLSYTWYDLSHNEVGTNSLLVITNATQSNSYYVTISNQYGSISSASAVLTVLGAPVVLANPSNYNRMQITFSGYTNGVSLTNFPVLVRLSTNIPGFSYAGFVWPSNGADLRFTSAKGMELPFEIDQWNPAGESQIWVQVPLLASTNDSITAYWGNAADSAMQPCNTNGAVWSTLSGSNNFLLVYHLSQSGFPFADSTLQYPATSGVPPALTDGVVGRGCAFNGSSQFFDAGLVNIGKNFSLSAWVNIAPAALSEQTIWCNKQGGWNTAGFDFYVNSWQTNDGKIYFDTADGSGGNVAARTAAHAVSFGQWHLLTGTMDGVNGSVHVYVDGVDQTINTGVDTAFQVTNYVRCGALLTGTPGMTGTLPFNGLMDEVRIESGVRSPAWVRASWATVANGAFATYGPIVPPAVTLNYRANNGQLVLTWTTGTLQSAPSVTGPYTDMTGAFSPYAVVPSSAQRYFRVRVQ
ncbi:MAG TPA: DUF2341 domain-containing protein, partial [Bacillota bacterium]|nr:DUF2341 domain-containing protein [Bacillota bacterium]